jgi:hypothetical protein
LTDSASNAVQEFQYDGDWFPGRTLPIALPGSSIAASGWDDNGTNLRIYYQSPDLALREHCYDHNKGLWQVGNYFPGKVPAGATITALAWFRDTKQLEVFWQASAGHLVGQKYSVAACAWQNLGMVVPSLVPGARTAALHWNSGNDLRVYYQGDHNDILERSFRKEGVAESKVSIVAKFL